MAKKKSLAQQEIAADKYLDTYFNELNKKTAAGVKLDPATVKRIPTALEGDEYFKIYNSIDKLDNLSDSQKLRLKLGMELGYGGGLRISEIMKLTRKNVSVTSDGLVILNFVGKGNKEGQVLLPPRASKLVQEVLNSAPDMGSESPLFPSERRGKFLYGGTFNTRMKDAARAAGFGEKFIDTTVSAHNLRHGFVTTLIRGGTSLSTVQQMARHADPKTTLGYSHVMGADVRSAILTNHPLGQIASQAQDFTIPKSLSIDNLAQVIDEDRFFSVKHAYSNFVSGAEDVNYYRAALKDARLASDLIENLVSEASQARSTLSARPDRVSYQAVQAGALPGTNLVPEPDTIPKSKRGVSAPAGRSFRTSTEGLALVLKTMGDSKLPVDKALNRLGNSAATFMFELENEIARGSNTAPRVLEAFKFELQRLFPDGLAFQGRFLVDILDDEGKVIAKAGSLASPHEAEAISHALYKAGYLEATDPDFKKAQEYFDSLDPSKQTKERLELRQGLDIEDTGRGKGSDPFTNVEFVEDKNGNVTKVLHRNPLSGASEKQPFFRVGGEAGFVLNEGAYEQAGFREKDTVEWAKRKPNPEYIAYFQYQERLRQAEQAAQVKSRGGMSAGEVTNQTKRVADANRALGILQAKPPPRPEVSNKAGFEAASSQLLGEPYNPQVTPKALPEPEPPKIEGPTTPLTDEEVEAAKSKRSFLRGAGRTFKSTGGIGGLLGLGLGFLMADQAEAEVIKKRGAVKDPESFALEKQEIATGVVYDVDPEDGKPRPGRRTGLPLEVLNQMLIMGRSDLIEKAADDWEKRDSLKPEVRKQIEETRALYKESRKTTVPVQEQEEFKLKALYPSGQKPGYRHPGSGYTGVPIEQRRSSNQPSFLERDQ